MGFLAKFWTVLTAAAVTWTACKLYKTFEVPPLPQLQHDFWWGPGISSPTPDTSIRQFQVTFEPEMLSDLKNRLNSTRYFTEPLEGVGFQYGFNNKYLKEVVDFWKTRYNFMGREKYLNQYSQYQTNIQGLDIHYLHVKPKSAGSLKVVPLLLLHGWPGSVVEFYKMIPYLITPRPGKTFIFELIIPSLPGYGYSQGASKPGLGEAQIAVMMNNLMKRLGYDKYVVQGGDWGSFIGSNMATMFPHNVYGYHSNFALVHTPLSTLKYLLGMIYPPFVVEKKYENRIFPISNILSGLMEETGYFHIQSTKPDTIGAALSDSPVGLAAYILEKFSTWTNNHYKTLPDGGLLKKYTMTELLDNVMIYWDSQCITTSMRLYSMSINKNQMALGLDLIPTAVPTAIARFEHELMFQPESQLKTKFSNIVQLSDFEDGGHFAAFEWPDVLAGDIWSAMVKFEEFYNSKETKKEL